MPGRTVAALVLAGALAACADPVVDHGHAVAGSSSVPKATTPFCLAVQDNDEALRPLAEGRDVPPDRLPATVDAVRRSNTELLTTAPQQLRPDVQRAVDVLNAELDALVRGGGRVAAVAHDPAAAAAASDPAATAATRRVADYVSGACPTQRS